MASTIRSARPSSRDEILEVFTALVARDGYERASLSTVAELAGISSKGTIVHHFGSKQRMLVLSHSLYIDRRIYEAERLTSEIDDPADQMAALMYSLLRAHRDDRAATVAFLREFTRFAADGSMLELHRKRHTYREYVTRCVERGKQTGLFGQVDTSLTTLQIFGMCNYVWTWYQPDKRAGPEEIASSFVRNLLGGLLVESSRLGDRFAPSWFASLNAMMYEPKPVRHLPPRS
jgi:TetR/AcrR family transcriptional regulator, cholesterol catabolism regulator